MYFASAVLSATDFCFLLVQDIIAEPKLKHTPEVLFLSSTLPTTLKLALPPSLEVTQSLLPLDVVSPPSLGVPLHTLESLPCLLPKHLMA
jgi:hypothetical protein